MSAQLIEKVICYIDGFNLYYGVLKNGPYKWLNLERYFRLLRPGDDIQRIRYFTARIWGPGVKDQDAYLDALATSPMIDIILGQFKKKRVRGECTQCPLPSPQFFYKTEEKCTDVNIALWMLHDAHEDLCDQFVLVTGDSDLAPAIGMVKDCYPQKIVIVYIPAQNRIRGAAVELRTLAHINRTLPLNLLPHAQFPSAITTSSGEIRKPASW